MDRPTWIVATGLILTLLLAAGAVPSSAILPDSGTMLVYNGDARSTSITYSLFADAAGKDLVVSSSLDDDLDGHDCVVLNINRSFTAADLDRLADYAQSGGRLIVIGDADGFSQGANPALNQVNEAVGTSIRLVGGSHEVGYHQTDQVALATLTLGVITVQYAYYAQVDAGGSGHELVSSETGAHALLAAEQVGDGYVVVSGDSNLLSDNDGSQAGQPGGYDTYDNGRLAFNLCNGLIALGVPSV